MDRRKRVNLTLNQKLEIIQQLESGVYVSRICKQYGIKKQTVSDIKKNKDKINNFVLKCDIGANVNPRKRMKLARETSLEEALLKWYAEQRSSGVPVGANELKSAAIKLANHMNILFKASDGWLWRFRKRHGIMNKRIYAKASSAPKQEIEPWLEVNAGDPGYHMTEREIDDVMILKNEDGSEDSEEIETIHQKNKLSVIRSHVDDLITFIDYTSDDEIQSYSTNFRKFRELIIKKQSSNLQRKQDYFFKAQLPESRASTSNINVIPEICLDVSSEDE